MKKPKTYTIFTNTRQGSGSVDVLSFSFKEAFDSLPISTRQRAISIKDSLGAEMLVYQMELWTKEQYDNFNL